MSDAILASSGAETRWAPAAQDARDELGLLVYQSRLIGADPSLVLRGGGNTSVKVVEVDHRGERVAVLRVKGSGSDLRTIERRDFPGVRLDDVLPLFARTDMSDEAMTAYLARTLMEPHSPRPSIETLLHAFIPAANVVHTHADAILALADTVDQRLLLEEAFAGSAVLIPYRIPGFRLAREVGEAVRGRPSASAVILLQHGLVTWGDSAAEAYERTVAAVEIARRYVAARSRSRVFLASPRHSLDELDRRRIAAALSPVIRGSLATERRIIAHYTRSPELLDFVGSPRAREVSARGAATPDHILNTGRHPLWVETDNPTDADHLVRRWREGLERWRLDHDAYVNRWRTDEPRLDGNPRIVLVPGVGMWTTGRDLRSAQLARDIYLHTIGIMAAAESVSSYRSISEQEAFRIEYWPLELFKLSLAPPERELERRVVLITGAAGGIGRAVALRLADAGAHLVVTDLDLSGAERVAELIRERRGEGTAIGCQVDVTRADSVELAFERASLEYGGVDVVVSNAGIAHCAPIEELGQEDWERTFAVNSTGHFLITRAALRLFRRQGSGGNLVVIASKNVAAPGRDFAAYSASKAAEVQLARVAAIEGGPMGVRVNVVNPDAVFRDSGLWSGGVREERARAHGIAPEALEEFYRARTLLGTEVRAEDVAEAVLFLASDRSSRTTGCILPVDGGVREAFPR